MRRFDQLTTVGVVTAALFAGGIVEAPSTYDAPVGIEATPETPDVPDVPEIDVSEHQLPQDIGRIALSTVKIQADTKEVRYIEPDGDILGAAIHYTTGSGTVVKYGSTRVVITAAHVAAPAGDHCGDEEVHVPGFRRRDTLALKAQAQTPSEQTDGNYTLDYNNGRDASVLVPVGDRRFKDAAAMTVQKQVALKPGDSIFSVGYGPRKDRTPDPIASEPALRLPIVVPGTVLEVGSGQVQFLTNIEPVSDNSDYNGVHHGDSGGTLVNGQGDYLGDVIAVLSEGNTYTGKRVEAEYGVDLPKSAEDKHFGVAVGQLIDQQDLREMVGGLEACDSGVPQYQKHVPEGSDINQLLKQSK